MRKVSFYFFPVIFVTFLISMLQAADNYSQWSYYSDITLNTTATGTLIDTNQIRFPLCIRLNPSDSFVFNTAQANGADIRFSKVNSGIAGAHFPYQIEYWDKTSKQAAIWVLIDTVKKNSNQVFKMFWGKGDAADSSRGFAVFDTAASRGFQAVWHLNEATGDTIRDATLNKFKGEPRDTLNAGVPANKVGLVGFGKDFPGSQNGSGSYYRIPNSSSSKLNFDMSNAYSISAWVNIDSINREQYFVSKVQYNLFVSESGNLTFSEIQTGSQNNKKYVQNNDSVSSNNQRGRWRYITAVHKPGTLSLYVDGALAGDTVLTGSADDRTTVYQVRLGRKPDTTTGWFNGTMDEVRFENIARSPDWIKLCYGTQKNDSSVSRGPVGVMPISSLRYPDSISFMIDSAIATMTPTFTGKVDSFAITPTLPGGLSLDRLNGSISGTPRVLTASAKYVVSAFNEAGFTNDTITISVYAPVIAPTIASQSGNQWVSANAAAATFWVRAAGTAPFTYSWTKNGAIIEAMNKDTLMISTVKKGDDGAIFRGSVRNSAGSIAGPACTLHVVAAVFDAKPKSGIDTLTVAFSDSSIGNSPAFPLARTWYFGDGDSSKELAPVHFYSKPGIFTAKLVAIVNGVLDSMVKTITIKSASLQADFKADTLIASGSLKVAFSDSSRGTVFNREWSFGDGITIADTGTHGPVEHIFSAVGSYTVRLVVYGPSGSASLTKPNYIAVRPANPIRLKISPASNSSVLLAWEQVQGADSIQVVYTSVKPVPCGVDIVSAEFSNKFISSSAVSDTVSGLQSMVRYYFGARIFSQGFWSFFTDSSTGAAKLFSDTDVVSIHPEIYLTSVSFDSVSNNMTVQWRIDTLMTPRDSLDVGIFWSIKEYQTDGLATPDSIKKNSEIIDSCRVQLSDALLYDTTYYFTLMLRESGKTWLPISDSSKGMVRTPAFRQQAVTYGISHPTAYADNRRIRITIDSSTFRTGTDNNTIERWKRPDILPGFLPVSEGFEFLIKYQSSPLNIGMRYHPLPEGRSLSNIKIYRYKNNQWLLERSPQWCDSAEGYVNVTTGDINSPFIAMIDTVQPKITILSRIEKPVPSNEPVIDDFAISDNIANASWNFQYAKGGYAFDIEHSDTGVFSMYESEKSTVIPGSLVSADQGVRAIIVVSDGIHNVTLNVSRRVIRETGSEVVTDSMKWVPLFVNAQLDSPEARNALRTLAGSGEWTYDNTKFRLFRWFSFPGNAMNDTDKYIEYTAALDSIFSLIPGRLLWIKTRRSTAIDFGKGVTLDLTAPFPVLLQAHSWTDIALPYKFDITVGDVLDATRAAGQGAEGLRMCRWFKDPLRNFVLNELYFPSLGMSKLQDRAAVFLAEPSGSNSAAYSVFNPSDADMQLYFPPIPAITSQYNYAEGKRAKMKGRGAIAIAARTADGSVLNTVYCALAPGKPGKRYFPAAPSLNGAATLRICDERMRQFGHIAATGEWDKGAGVGCDVAVNNRSSKAEVVTITLSGEDDLPRDMRFMLFDPSTNSFTEAGEDGVARAQVGVGGGETGYLQLIAGSAEYCAKVKQSALTMKTALIGMYPNPFRQSVRIRFGLPFGFVGKVQFSIFDACGREIVSAAMRGHSGMNDFIWAGINRSGRFAAPGLYILRMIALNAKGERLGMFERKLTYLP